MIYRSIARDLVGNNAVVLCAAPNRDHSTCHGSSRQIRAPGRDAVLRLNCCQQPIPRFHAQPDRNARSIWHQAKTISLFDELVQRENGAFQLDMNPLCARISSRSSSLNALLFLRRLKNSSRTLTTIALTLTPSASAHSLSLSRASAPTGRS